MVVCKIVTSRNERIIEYLREYSDELVARGALPLKGWNKNNVLTVSNETLKFESTVHDFPEQK